VGEFTADAFGIFLPYSFDINLRYVWQYELLPGVPDVYHLQLQGPMSDCLFQLLSFLASVSPLSSFQCLVIYS